MNVLIHPTLMALVVSLALVPASTLTGGQDDELVREKRAHLDFVLQELSQRDTSHLTPDQRARREVNLERLRQYRDGGVFPENVDFPGRRVPYFIDHEGTRCAMAHLLDASGGGTVLERLAAESNNAYVAELTYDLELAAWVERLGFTLDEIAFIQGPSRARPRWSPPDVPSDAPVPGFTPSDRLPGPGAPGPGTVPSGARKPPTGASPPAPDRTPGVAGHSRRARPAEGGASWQTWWELNRDELVDIRRLYHENQPMTATGGRAASRPRGWRPTAESLTEDLVPALEKIAVGDEDLAVDALVALASARIESESGWLQTAVKAFLKRPTQAHREYAILALGIAGDAGAREPLRDLLLNTRAGREWVGERERVPTRLRAMAAIALGRCGESDDLAHLSKVLISDPSAELDLRSACVTGLGLLAEHAPNRREVTRRLVEILESEDLPAQVRAQAPFGLARSADPAALGVLSSWVARFRGPREVRRACSLALAEAAPLIDASLLEVLIAQARRDPDPSGRRFAIVTIGRLLDRQPLLALSSETEPMLRRLAVFYGDGLSGFFRQPADVPWIALSAALFGRSHPEQSAIIRERLMALLQGSASSDHREAAALALGLLGHSEGSDLLRKMLGRSKAPRLQGYIAEALGIAGDRSSRDALSRLCLEGPSDWLRHQAALGLGYLADPQLVPHLLRALASSSNDGVRAALTHVIGQLGDRRALPFLLTLARDEKKDEATRRRALGALGRIAERGDHSWTLELRRGYDFTSASDTMSKILALF